MTTEKEQATWETETGLPNDIDAYIANAKFGVKDEYAQAVAATSPETTALMMIFDLVDEKGDLQGSQGYSIGTGWIVSDDGQSISHPKRKNVVGSSMYGLIQNRVVKELKVDMESRGVPTDAKPWNGLGFHWLLQPHKTVGGDEVPGLMPVEYIGVLGAEAAQAAVKEAAAPATAAASELSPTIDKALTLLARVNDVSTFQEKALGMPQVASNDVLMANVLDEGPEGYWATHQAE